MAKRPTLQEKMARLSAFEGAPLNAEAAQELRRGLAGSSSALAAKAARVAAEAGAQELVPDLAEAFLRFVRRPATADKGCVAKTAIVEALNRLDADEEQVFLRGVRHVQPEPVWGGRVDTADNLRAKCLVGLVRTGHPQAPFETVRLLADPMPEPRRVAARALGHISGETGELLLRLKALSGDAEPDVLGECFSALMEISPERSLEFVADFLDREGAVAEEAALALGASRRAEAFLVLKERRRAAVHAAIRRMLLLPIALTRRDEAFDMLLGVAADEPRDQAEAAVAALKVWADDERRRGVIEQTVAGRDAPWLAQAYAREFAGR